MRIVLASKSLRRIEILKSLGLEFDVDPSNTFEFVESYSSNEDLVMQLSRQKGEEVFKRNEDALVLSFDTLVFFEDEVLGKPQSEEECIKMIRDLSNNYHFVSTGVYLRAKDYEESFAVTAKVHMLEISDEDILKYAKTEEPYDKAGAYAIQGFIGRYVDHIEGDFYTIVGLPKAIVYKKIREYLDNKR
ncbi:MAG: Maf family protein [Gammaproteobacteria bacterium]|nr:Maf family protein [Gammaproteobacteria bacterium]